MASRGSSVKRAAKVGLPILGVAALMVGLFMVLLGGPSSVASTEPTADMTLFIHAAPVGSCNAGDQLYDVLAKIDVTNTSSDTITFASTDFTAQAITPSGTHDVPVTVVDAGTPPFQAGQTLAAGDKKTYGDDSAVELHVTVPCNTEHGHVFAHLRLDGSETDITDSGIFQCGTEIPLGTVGFAGLTLLLGVVFLFVQRRKTRSRRFAGLEA